MIIIIIIIIKLDCKCMPELTITKLKLKTLSCNFSPIFPIQHCIISSSSSSYHHQNTTHVYMHVCIACTVCVDFAFYYCTTVYIIDYVIINIYTYIIHNIILCMCVSCYFRLIINSKYFLINEFTNRQKYKVGTISNH